MTTYTHLKQRTKTRRTSTVWPFLYTGTRQGVVQNVYDASAAKMVHEAPSTPPRVKIPRKTPARC